ncbi:hypothetical protein [Staphylococcus delphini]|uniref:Phage protein n=1 Tax=Staphylococcus delphini TaxID=53344 RepID=A0AAX0QVM1_9STAP|nr:hypothetical protein [Staphylococcus delphini]PCF51588.1 hypothetical protein B5C07_03595 [Staphylococcus delphini]PNZ94542.1 hypothetical protein CD148_06755 [Staphylococcus delphini]RIZ54948.1 hypothetical protein CDL68_04330 [Staphylococcus delphini]VED61777.1 Uncharacterised protein [Staphylococcus delphini]
MCLKTNFRGYHGTDKSHFDSLDKDKEFSSQTLPCDLGNGLYFFIDRVNKTGEAIENAKKYLSRWKPKYKNKIIVEMELDLEQDKVLDLDDQVNQDIFNLFIDENEEDIYNELDHLIENNTKNRGNIDGLVLEIMIRAYDIDVKAIMKETYTQFDMSKQRKRSNIPNDKELCLREYSAIKKKSICKELW